MSASKFEKDRFQNYILGPTTNKLAKLNSLHAFCWPGGNIPPALAAHFHLNLTARNGHHFHIGCHSVLIRIPVKEMGKMHYRIDIL